MEEPVLPNIIRTPGFVRPLSIPPDIRQFEKVTMPDRYCEVAQCQAQMLSFGLQTDPIIDGISEPLFAAQGIAPSSERSHGRAEIGLAQSRRRRRDTGGRKCA